MTPFQPILILLALMWFVAVLHRELKHDWKVTATGGTINHKQGLIRRALWLIPSWFLLSIHTLMKYKPEVWIILWSLMLIASLWFGFFDGWYNKHYNRSIFHVPKPHPNSAITDKLLYPLPIWLRALIKIGLIVTAIIMYSQNY